MSAILGYSSTISEGNSANDRIRAINRQIDAQNSLARDNFNSLRQQEKENKIIAESNLENKEAGEREDEGEETGKVVSSVNDLVAQRNKSDVVKDGADTKPSEVDTENRPQGDRSESNVTEESSGNQEPLESTDNESGRLDEAPREPLQLTPEDIPNLKDDRFPTTSRLLGQGEYEIRPVKEDYDSDRVFTTTEEGRVLPSGESGTRFSVMAYPVNESRPSGARGLINPIEEPINTPSTAGSLGEGAERIANTVPEVSTALQSAREGLQTAGNVLSKGKDLIQKAGTTGGFLGEGVSGLLKGATIATGGYDAVKDIVDPKSFKNMDTAGKVSNIANVVSGGLEGAGLALEATGVGAPLGALIQGAGLLSGAVGLGAGLIDDIRGDKKQSAAVKSMPTTPQTAQAPQQQKLTYQSAFGGGQLVQ